MKRVTCLLVLMTSSMMMYDSASAQVLAFWLGDSTNLGIVASADEEASEGDSTRWETSLVGRIGGSQTGFYNWAEGGADALSISTNLQGKAVNAANSWKQVHESRFAIGFIKQSGTDMRKAEDVIRLASSLQYQGEGFFRIFNPTLALTLRTQFWEGFNYDRNPIPGDVRPAPVKVSDFFSPATLTESIGLSHRSGRAFSQRLGIGGKQTFVAIPELRPVYGVDPAQIARYQFGIESRTDVETELFTNVHFKSTLGLFAAFNNPELPDMLWESLLTMKINSWLNVNFEFAAFYDRDVSRLIQIKEVLSVGLTVIIV
jgi:hypothetical protein